MNNKRYLARLNKLLAALPRQTRADILLEIESHVAAAQDDAESLFNSFGRPEELAQQYLQDEVVTPSFLAKIGHIGKKTLLSLSVIITLLVILVPVLVYSFYLSDDFNYADETAVELDTIWLNSHGSSFSMGSEPMTIHVEQSDVVFYWHDQPELYWSCGGSRIQQLRSGRIDIVQKHCFVKLPAQQSTIRSTQSSIVLVRPQAATDIKLKQSRLRIAESGNQYDYQIDNRRSRIDRFNTQPGAKTLTITATESEVTAYEW